MREPAFLRKNKDKWLAYETALFDENGQQVDPDQLANLYIQLTDDLGYARTFFPDSQTVKYLNGLAARTHLLIYKNKKEKRNRLLSFWTEELPIILRESRREMLFALVIFAIFFLIGYISTLKNAHYFDDFMPPGYGKMSAENIAAGDPTAVYKGSASFPMFIRIFFNNVRIA